MNSLPTHVQIRRWMVERALAITVLIALVCTLVPAAPALASSLVPVTVTINEVTQKGPPNIYDQANFSQSDFFAVVSFAEAGSSAYPPANRIQGPRIDDQNAIKPNWSFTRSLTDAAKDIFIRIEIWDYNGSTFPMLPVDVDPGCQVQIFGCSVTTVGQLPVHPPEDFVGLDLRFNPATGSLFSETIAAANSVIGRLLCVRVSGTEADVCFTITLGNGPRQITTRASLLVTKTTDTNDGACTSSDCSLREAITAATDGDTIVIPSTICPATPTFCIYRLNWADTRPVPAGEPPINPGHLSIWQQSLTIQGDGKGVVIIEQTIPQVRVFDIFSDADVMIRDLTIRGGQAGNNSTAFWGHQHGGGIHNHGTLRLVNVTLTNNRAIIAGAGGGGALYNAGAASLTNVTISLNGAINSDGGGISGNKPVTMINTIVTDNGGSNCSASASFTSASKNNLQFPDATCLMGFTAFVQRDPLLISAPDGIFELQQGSPAIDAGDNTVATNRDQRGLTRVVDGNRDGSLICDIGAIEFVPAVQSPPIQFPTPSSSFGPNQAWTTYPYYGDRNTFFADVTGDGKADAIAVNTAGVAVLRSDGGSFLGTAPYYGDKGTFFADVTGDGKADAIVVNTYGITVRRSNGSQFLDNEPWTTYPYYGDKGTFFADVTGDGKADAILLNTVGVAVLRSDGSRFLDFEAWTTNPYYGEKGTYFADVTGDGKADAIVVNSYGITVRRSDGGKFLGNESWTSNLFYYGDRDTFFTDVTGDGKADAIMVNNTGITVRRSDGSQFLGYEPWTTNPYYGDKGTFFADVTGDSRADAIVVNTAGITVRYSQ